MGYKKENIDLDDIVFEKRNREYGAYPIRKGYTKRFWMSFSIASFLIIITFLLVGGVFEKNYLPPPQPKVIDIHIKEYSQPKPLSEKKYITTIKTNKELKVNTSKAEKSPVVKNNATIKNGQLLIHPVPENNISSDAINGPDLDVKPAIQPNISPTIVSKSHFEDIETKDSSSTKVTLLPHYLGGDSAWYQYLRNNININNVLKKGAMPSVYTAVIAFVVHTDSTISDFKIVKEPGYGMGNEALRIVQKSGKWVPGRKKNIPVKFAQLQTIVFKIKN